MIVDQNPLANLKVLYGTGAIHLNDKNEVERVGGEADEANEELRDDCCCAADSDRERGHENRTAPEHLVIARRSDVSAFGFVFCALDLGGESSRYGKGAFLSRAVPKIRFQVSNSLDRSRISCARRAEQRASQLN